MSTFTKEQLLERAREKVKGLEYALKHPGAFADTLTELEEELELARIALASLEAEPVGEVSEQRDGLVMDGMVDLGGASTHRIIKGASKMKRLPLGTKFYTAPPAPVSVPDAMEMDDDFDSAFEHGKAVGWNAYRAAMLQSGNFRENKNSSTNNFREIAETSTNYPVIPSEVLSAIQKVAKIRADFDDFDGDRRGIGDCLDEAEQELIVTINKYASQLAAEPIAPNDVREQTAIPQVPVTPDGWISCSERMPAQDDWILIYSKHGEYMAGQVQGEYVELSDGTLSWLGNALFWTPLPEPPQEVNRG